MHIFLQPDMKKSNIGGKKYLVNLCGGLLPSCGLMQDWENSALGV
jgi:hypothetical protein